MALSGLFMIVFLVVHIAGNFALFRSDYGKFFNQYSEFMSHNMLIQIIQYVLFAAILIHIYMAWRLTAKNRAARPQGYAVNYPNENSTWISRNMGITGTVIALFLIAHLYTFWFRYHNSQEPRWISYDGGETWFKDMYNMVETAFTFQDTGSLIYGTCYLIALVFFFGHLAHGIQSSARTTGVNHKSYTPFFQKLSYGMTIFFAFGFATMPLAFMTGLKKQFTTEAQVPLLFPKNQDNVPTTKLIRPNPAGLKAEETGDKPNILIVPTRVNAENDLVPDVQKGDAPGPAEISLNR